MRKRTDRPPATLVRSNDTSDGDAKTLPTPPNGATEKRRTTGPTPIAGPLVGTDAAYASVAPPVAPPVVRYQPVAAPAPTYVSPGRRTVKLVRAIASDCVKRSRADSDASLPTPQKTFGKW